MIVCNLLVADQKNLLHMSLVAPKETLVVDIYTYASVVISAFASHAFAYTKCC